MKTFREYTGGDTVNPYYHSYAGSLLGPGLGQYIPVADLNAQRQLLGPKKENGHECSSNRICLSGFCHDDRKICYKKKKRYEECEKW